MKKYSLGANFLILYAILLGFFFVSSNFSLYGALSRGSQPLLQALPRLPQSILEPIINLGANGILVFCITIQALILYLAANAISRNITR